MSDHRGNRLSEQLISQIRRLKLAGHSYREIATISGVAKSTIEIYCKHFPPTSAKPGPKTKNSTGSKPIKADADPTSVFDDDEPSLFDLEADQWPRDEV